MTHDAVTQVAPSPAALGWGPYNVWALRRHSLSEPVKGGSPLFPAEELKDGLLLSVNTLSAR